MERFCTSSCTCWHQISVETVCLAICRYLVSLIASDADGVHTDLNEFGLEAMNVALNAGGAGERNFKLIVWNTGVHHQAPGQHCPALHIVVWQVPSKTQHSFVLQLQRLSAMRH